MITDGRLQQWMISAVTTDGRLHQWMISAVTTDGRLQQWMISAMISAVVPPMVVYSSEWSVQ